MKRFDPDSISNELLLEELKKLSVFLGKTPSKNDIEKFGNDITKRIYLYYRRFGSFQKACEIAGLNKNLSGSQLKYSDDELLNEIVKVKSILNGKTPTQEDLANYGKYPIGAFKRHFGCYNNALKKLNIMLIMVLIFIF